MAQKNLIAILMVLTLAGTTCLLSFNGNVSAVEGTNLIGGWNHTNGGVYSQENGVITLSGDESCPGPYLVREFKPTGDFEVSLDLKAETLGEVSRDPMGAGEGFNFGFFVNYSCPQPGVYFELRARAGGQFLLVWHDNLCDQYGWACNWEPFVYNSLGYNNGYAYWHPNPPQDRSNSTVKPDVWYTLRLKVQKQPFVVTGEVYNEQGVLLGSYRLNSINNFTFDDIRYFEMTSVQGGTFYVRNITITSADCSPTPSPTPVATPDVDPESSPTPSPSQVTSLNMFALESNSTVTAFAFNSTSYELSFNVTGESGTTGYAKLTIAKTLLPDAQNLTVNLDGKQLNYTISQTDESWILDFNYHHSTHQVSVFLPKSVTVNPVSTLDQYAWIIAAAFAALLLLLLGLLLFALRNRDVKQ